MRSPNRGGVAFPLIGGVKGSTFIRHTSGGVWAISEDPSIKFDRSFNLGNGFDLRIVPAVPYNIQYPPFAASESPHSAPQIFEIHMRMRPGGRYHVILSHLYDYRGKIFSSVSFEVVVSSRLVIEKPLARRGRGFYCVLGHPEWLEWSARSPVRFSATAGKRLKESYVTCARIGPIVSHLATVPDKNNWDWLDFDRAIAGAMAYGVVPNPLVLDAQGVAAWATHADNVGARNVAFETPALYSSYVAEVVKRVNRRYKKIRRFECGVNEPNATENFRNTAWAARFPESYAHTGRSIAPFLLQCYRVVHSVDSGYEVDAPGLETGSPGDSYLRYLDDLYAAGCRYGTCWDVLTVHEYPWTDPSIVLDTGRLTNLYGNGSGPSLAASYKLLQAEAKKKELNLRTGVRSYPIAITETGYSSDALSSNGLAECVQASFTAKLLRLLSSDKSVKYVVWANLEQAVPGLFGGMSFYRPNASRKPAWYVWRDFIRF